jgi:hypothetical protein
MNRSSAACALLMVSALLAGSSRSGPIVRQSGVAHSGAAFLGRASAPAPTPVLKGQVSHVRDTWLMMALAGGLVALQLRRMHRSVRLEAHSARPAALPDRAGG